MQALSAPGAALGEVRQLREELFALRRGAALAEQKEAEVRRELSHVREQVRGDLSYVLVFTSGIDKGIFRVNRAKEGIAGQGKQRESRVRREGSGAGGVL